ncbi:hypothetical protein BC835DRAFT_1421356 [Cytidiella melzeri]|nr:hypothetical protein BC835DRAFT_1421356 [Cytidiella melzeri]
MAQRCKAGSTRNPVTSCSESTRRKQLACSSSRLQRTHVEASPDNKGKYIDIEAVLSSLEGEEDEEEEATPTRRPSPLPPSPAQPITPPWQTAAAKGDNGCVFGHNQQHHPAQPSDLHHLEEYADVIHANGWTQYKKYLDPKNHVEDKPLDVPPVTIARFHRFLIRLLAGQDIPPNLLEYKAFWQFIRLLQPELTKSKIPHCTKGRELILCQWLEWFHKATKKLQDTPGKISMTCDL